MHRTLLLWICAALPGASGLCAEKPAPANSAARLQAVPAWASLVTAAQATSIPLEKIDPAIDSDRLDPGDSITALITLFDGGRPRKQWLVYLEAVAPDAKESAKKPGPPMVLYSSFGGTQTCVSVPAFVFVRTLGPFLDTPKANKPAKWPEKNARFELNKGFLSLGLHHAAASFHALEDGPIRGSWTVSTRPFSEGELAKGQKLASGLNLTPERERAMIGAIPALISYLEIIRNSPGLSEIFFEIVDLPSVWSILRNAGIKSVGLRFAKGVAAAQPALWRLPATAPAYHFPMVLDLNEQPALRLTFVVTSPDPPLLACGGVVGLLAENASNPQKHLTLRVVSARRVSVMRNDSTGTPLHSE